MASTSANGPIRQSILTNKPVVAKMKGVLEKWEDSFRVRTWHWPGDEGDE